MERTIGIVMSIVIVLVVGGFLVAPSSWLKKLLGGQKKDD